MKNILIKIFSYYGKFDKKEYILIGCILPIALLPIGIVIHFLEPIIGSVTSLVDIIGLLLIFSIALSSSIKRARAKSSHTSLLMIIVEALSIS